MEFVGDYRKAQKLAEALRKKEAAIGNLGVDSSPIVTQGAGAFPGQVQANYGAPLAQIGLALMGKRAGDKAAEQEEIADTKRMEAINAIMQPAPQQNAVGNGAAGPATIGAGTRQMTPQSVMALQELGFDAPTLKLMQGDKPQLGAITQAATSEAGINALEATGTYSKEQADAARASLKASAAEAEEKEKRLIKYKEDNKKFAPQTPRGMTEQEFAMKYPEEYRRQQAAKGLSKTPQGNPYTKKVSEEQAKVDVARIAGRPKLDMGLARANALLDEFEVKPYNDGAKYRAWDTAGKMMGLSEGSLRSDYDPNVQRLQQAMSQFHLDAMEQMRGFGQVTESEQGIIRSTQFDRYDDAKTMVQKLKTIKGVLERWQKEADDSAKRMRAGTAVLPPEDNSSLDAEIDALMGAP